MSDGESNNPASSGLFAVFLLSIYSLVLIPYTIHYLCSAGEDATTQPVAKDKKKKSWSDRLRRVCTKGNLLLVLLWVLWCGVVAYSQASMQDMKPFDPFEILELPRDATDRDIKKAYRKLSLVYHPDKNPDPKAAAYFASYITKAYAALTDEVSRQNYEKYGHPDGPQGMNLGVALPAWMFSKDKGTAPLMLLGLVGVCILLPLGVMSWYMLTASKFTGPNAIMNDTLQVFALSKYAVKESQSLVRIPETLLCAMEFITLYTPSEQNAPMDELRKIVTPCYTDLMSRSNKTFWQRKASLIKVHMLLLAHLERLGDEVPPALQADLKYVRTKAPLLLEEMLKIATLPRTQLPVGWMTPALACVEMMQCLAQGMPISVRKGSGKAGDVLAPLMQLPGFDSEVVKRLRKRKVNSLAELQALPEHQRVADLQASGLDAGSVDAVGEFLSALPRLKLAVKVEVDEPDGEVQQGDETHCKVRVLLGRPAHRSEGFSLRGSAVRAYTPNNPVVRDESWYFFLVDAPANQVWAWKKVNLMEAEKVGLAHPEAFPDLASPSSSSNGAALALTNGTSTNSSGSGATAAKLGSSGATPSGSRKDLPALAAAADGGGGEGGGDADGPEPLGQEVDLGFFAWQRPGTYNLQLIVMSDCWVGADETMAVKLRINPPSVRAAVADVPSGRAARRLAAAAAGGADSADEDDSDASDSGSGSGSEDEDDYDSEETGEEESEEEGSSSD